MGYTHTHMNVSAQILVDAHTCTQAPQACSPGSRRATASSLPIPTVIPGGRRKPRALLRGLLCFAVFRSLAFKISPKDDSNNDGLSSTGSLGALSNCHLDPPSHLCE